MRGEQVPLRICICANIILSLPACRRFYAPQVFSTFGSGRSASLLNTVIIGAGTSLQATGFHQGGVVPHASSALPIAPRLRMTSPVWCAVNVVATLVAILGVDRLGRRTLFIFSGIAMVACEIIVGVLLGYYFHVNHGSLPDNVSNGVLAVICIYTANFAWSWGTQPALSWGQPIVWLKASLVPCLVLCLRCTRCWLLSCGVYACRSSGLAGAF